MCWPGCRPLMGAVVSSLVLGRRRPAAVAKARQPWDDAEKAVGRKLDDALAALAASARASAAAGGGVEGLLGSLDWDTLAYNIGDLQPDLGGASLAEAMTQAVYLGKVKARLAFDLVEERAVNYARQRAGELIVQITDQVRDTVRGFVVDGLSGGNSIYELTSRIRDVIPLHDRFANAVDRQFKAFFEQGMAEGKTFDQAMRAATEQAQRYAERLRSVRAENIARTEVMTASQAGRFDGWSAVIGGGEVGTDWRKEWITGDQPCDDCDPSDGEVVDWDAPFSTGVMMPPLHPSCRCVAVLRSPSTSLRAPAEKARQQQPELVVSYTLGAVLIASALAVGRTKTRQEHEQFVTEQLEAK